MREPIFAVVIPAYNEVATIRDVAARALQHVGTVIVVDDGSTDGTAAALRGLPITLVTHTTNRGKSASLRSGLAQAVRSGADAAITLDGDGQHRPEDVPKMVEAYLRDTGSIVIGARLHEKKRIPRARYLANRFANFWVTRAAGRAYPDTQSGFRIYPANFLRLILGANHSTRFVFETETLIDAARLGFQSVAVPIAAIYDAGARPSHFRPILDVLLITRMVAGKIVRNATWRNWRAAPDALRRSVQLRGSHPIN
jgi:glycosyltransferase involved in cell wall biosynthesis